MPDFDFLPEIKALLLSVSLEADVASTCAVRPGGQDAWATSVYAGIGGQNKIVEPSQPLFRPT